MRSTKDLALSPGQSRALQFFDLDLVGEAELDNEFTVRDFLDGVIQDMKDEDPRVRIAARRFFWTMKKDIATMSGHIGKATSHKEVDADGTTRQKTTISAQVLVNRLKGTNPHERPDNSGQHTVINPSISHDSGSPTSDPEIDGPSNLSPSPKGLPAPSPAGLGNHSKEGSSSPSGLPDSGRNPLGERRPEHTGSGDHGGAVQASDQV